MELWQRLNWGISMSYECTLGDWILSKINNNQIGGKDEHTLHAKLPLTIFDSHQKCSQSWTTIFDTRIKGVGALLSLALTQL